uniref:Uncharacterized protein n=1 Tax=Podarcis muralis TaxID=64176 RepID=A0A670K7Z5_PODMU
MITALFSQCLAFTITDFSVWFSLMSNYTLGLCILPTFIPSFNSVWRGFILVHLNIHDSLHFCSKRHLFI